MNITSVGFLLFIIVVSGAIAYYADQLGKKLGKRRYSLGPIRPRQIASIGTVMLGIVVSAVSIAMAMLFSRDLRTALLEGQKLIQRKDEAERQLDDLRKDVKDAQSINVRLGTEGKRLADQNKAKTVELAQRQLMLRDRQKQIGELNRKFSDLQRRSAGYQVQLRSIKIEFDRTVLNLNTRQKELTARVAELRSVNTELSDVKEQLKAGVAQLKVAVNQHNEVAQQNLRLETEKQTLEREVGTLQANITSLKGDRDLLATQRDKAQQDLESTRKSLQEAEDQLRSAQSNVAILKEAFTDIDNVSRYGQMIFARKDEITRLALDSGLSYEAARDALTSLIRSSRTIATERGAKGNAAAGIPVAGIFNREDLRTRQTIMASEIEKNIIGGISGLKNPIVLVAYASVNTFVGEPVSLDIVTYMNPIIYRKGQVVAERRMDGSKPEAEIFRQLTEFFGNEVRTNAIRAKMIRRIGTEKSLGELSLEQILDLVHQIRQYDRTIRVQAIAENETRAADSLILGFKFR